VDQVLAPRHVDGDEHGHDGELGNGGPQGDWKRLVLLHICASIHAGGESP
jgi:hypothetical protein